MENIEAIKRGRVITPFKTIENGVVVFKGEKIVAVGRQDQVKTPLGAKTIDASGKIVAPGFIDVHIHGGKGRNVMDGSCKEIKDLAKFAAGHGTTSFLATTTSAPHSDLLNVAEAVKMAMEEEPEGAEVLGVHLEGPYISLEKRGAQNAQYVRLASIPEFLEIWEASNHTVKIVTLAPEAKGSKRLLAKLRNLGVVASVGHSNATYDAVVEAIKDGVRHASHTFNGMRAFHHREPGVVGAVLLHDELTAELISDNFHVHPAAMKLLIKVKGADKVVLITDAIEAADMPDGKYGFGERDVVVKNGVCRLESGELAGSTLTMDKAVKNIVKSVGLPLATAIRMATANPAAVVGIDEGKGSLEPEKDADIVIVDNDINVYLTIVKGKIVYSSVSV